jgi:hypothetical protein
LGEQNVQKDRQIISTPATLAAQLSQMFLESGEAGVEKRFAPGGSWIM